MIAGRYRIDGLLGRGGMSEVYFGYDERLDRPVAVKLLQPPPYVPAAPDSPEAAEILDAIDRDQRRFLREIRVTARLELAGVPAIYDTGVEDPPGGALGTSGERRLWVVMQLLRGATVETLLDGVSFSGADVPSVAWAAAVVAQVAAVLADVHHVDIVHRDIKPANIMVSDGGLVKVLDFGIAILRGAGALPRLTQVDRTVGTPAYMSPEQWAGQLVTPASDVYSLGCLLYELLTGDVPFHGTSLMPLRVAHQEAPVPSVRARRPVTGSVDDLLATMMAKNPGARPSAAEVYRALLPLAMGGGAQDVGVLPGGDRGRDPVRPFRQPLLGTDLVGVAGQAPPADDIGDPGDARGTHPEAPLTEAEAERLRADVQSLLDDDHPSEVIGLLEAALARAAPGSLPELRMRHTLAAALLMAGQYGRAAALFEQAGASYRRYLGAADPWALDCAYQAGQAYAQAGKPEKALPQLRYFVANSPASAATDPDEMAKVLESRFVIAQLLATEGDNEAAIAELRAVRPLLVAAYGANSAQVSNLDKQARLLNGGALNVGTPRNAPTRRPER